RADRAGPSGFEEITRSRETTKEIELSTTEDTEDTEGKVSISFALTFHLSTAASRPRAQRTRPSFFRFLQTRSRSHEMGCRSPTFFWDSSPLIRCFVWCFGGSRRLSRVAGS